MASRKRGRSGGGQRPPGREAARKKGLLIRGDGLPTKRGPSARRTAGVIGIAAAVAVAIVTTYVLIIPPPEDDAVQSQTGSDVASESAADPNLAAVADDPLADGWDSEAFAEAALGRLKSLIHALIEMGPSPAADRPAEFPDWLTGDFGSPALRPRSLTLAFSDGPLSVRRWLSDSDDVEPRKAADNTVHSNLVAAWRSLHEFLQRDGMTPRVAVKIERVEQLGEIIETQVLFSAYAEREDQSRQVQAIWHCRWERSVSSQSPRLASIELRRYEEVECDQAAGWRFVDCTTVALGESESFRRQFLIGTEDWLARTVKGFDRTLWGDQGMAIGDANGDGRDDLYVCDLGLLPNRLFIQQADGTLRDEAALRGVDFLDHSRGALFVDLDNDGDQDLALAASAALLLLENDGLGNFGLRQSRTDVVDAHSLAAADYDADGRLDLYACLYHKERYGQDEYPFPVPYHDARNGGRNVLLRNGGDWRFDNVTAAVGLDAENDRWSLAAAWEDYDNDGDADLYVANDFGRNCLYRNDRGQFREVAAAAGVEDVGSGMSVAWGDYDHDGFVDLYVSNMYSTAGGRIAHQGRFQPNATPELKAVFQRMGKGNTLFRNRGDGTFEDVSEQSAVARARWAWGAKFLDVNNDAWEDLIVANGFVTRDDERDL